MRRRQRDGPLVPRRPPDRVADEAAARTSETALAGDRVASLHTAQSDDQQPLVSLEGIEQIARFVASML